MWIHRWIGGRSRALLWFGAQPLATADASNADGAILTANQLGGKGLK